MLPFDLNTQNYTSMQNDKELVTVEALKKALPSKKKTITQEAVDIINASMDDPEFQGETLMKAASLYEHLMERGRYSVPEYLNALRFCAYTSTEGCTNAAAYKRIFAHRKFVKDRVNMPKDSNKYQELLNAASRYAKSKLVHEINTASQVPLHLLFTGHRYKAVAILADIMVSSKYDRDRINAAKELLAATKAPDNVKLELDIGSAQSNVMEQFSEQLAEIAHKQKELLESGRGTLKQFGAMKGSAEIVDGEVIDE